MAKYLTALSHIALAGTGLYCLNKQCSGLPPVSFGIIVVNSIIGVWKWGNPSYGQKADKLYNFTSILQDLFVLPCVLAEMWLRYDYQTEIAYAHILAAFLPLMSYVYDKEDTKLTGAFLGANCLSLGIVSCINENYYGISAAISFAFNYFFIRRESQTYFDIPPQDLYNYSMCFFAVFAMKALTYAVVETTGGCRKWLNTPF